MSDQRCNDPVYHVERVTEHKYRTDIEQDCSDVCVIAKVSLPRKKVEVAQRLTARENMPVCESLSMTHAGTGNGLCP